MIFSLSFLEIPAGGGLNLSVSQLCFRRRELWVRVSRKRKPTDSEHPVTHNATQKERSILDMRAINHI